MLKKNLVRMEFTPKPVLIITLIKKKACKDTSRKNKRECLI